MSTVYEVFARKNRGEAIRHIGWLTAPDDDLARVYAYQMYDEERWLDMWVTPRDRLLEVFNRRDADVPADRGGAREGRADRDDARGE